MITDDLVKDVDRYLDVRQQARINGAPVPVKLYENKSLKLEEFIYLVVRQLIREQKLLLLLASGALCITLAAKIINRFF